MHPYRTHHCNELDTGHISKYVKLSGWIHRKRDHGNLLFIDIRDHYGITQLVFTDQDLELKKAVSNLRVESVITIEGIVVARNDDTRNSTIATGAIEVLVKKYYLESAAEMLPFSINSKQEASEEMRLKYRFLDLRRNKLHQNIILRSAIIADFRNQMIKAGFVEFQTPILTASSPEGARDYLVPSRIHPGKFYALPQAPQQFKQMLMVSGFDKYFQIAPCFRDEDARADRSPGEFYQLDIEMAFVTQEEIFAVIEPIMYQTFTKFGKKKVSPAPFVRIPYAEAMLKFGSDKPDLRNPIVISDVTALFKELNIAIFQKHIKDNAVVRAIPAVGVSVKPRAFFEKMAEYAISEGGEGLAYIQFTQGVTKGPLAKFLTNEHINSLKNITNTQDGDAIFFVVDKAVNAAKLAGKIRTKLGYELALINDDFFAFCWITDFPLYELNEETRQIEFSHNPFSMPQGGLEVLEKAKTMEQLLEIKAFQYDIVCNGVELSSGAIRNHKPEIMYKVFAGAGYSSAQVDSEFGGMIRAFKFGAPPHGGIAPGIDRIVMLLTSSSNIREIIAFPLNQQAEDLLMNAPGNVSAKQLRELHLNILLP